MIEVLASRVFYTRTLAHIAHLKSKSFAEHSALGSFYEQIIDDIDALVEAYQGCFGLIDINPQPISLTPKAIVVHLEKEADWIMNNRSKFAKNTPALENLVDNLTGTYLSTIYKLRNLA